MTSSKTSNNATSTSSTSQNNVNINSLAVRTLTGMLIVGLSSHTSSAWVSTSSISFVATNQYSSMGRLFSSVGGGGDIPPPDDDDDDDEGLRNFLTPKEESENLQRAREFMAETSLPLSFDVDDASEDVDDAMSIGDIIDTVEEEEESSASSSAMVGAYGSPSVGNLFKDQPTPDLLAKNPYMQVVSRLSPSELISKFTATTSPRVQEAVRSTILGLIGSLPKMAFDTTTITSGQRLASLMFQLQMTGYMFKNAEYRLSLKQSLGMQGPQASKFLLEGSAIEEYDDDEEGDPLLTGKIRGKLKIKYGALPSLGAASKSDDDGDDSSSSSGGMEMEVDAAAYMSELRSEVSRLKDELIKTRDAKEEALQKDLLTFIRTLPPQELKSLTDTMSPDVLVCMKGLVQAVLAGVGDGKIGPNTVTEQSGEAMAQLCMWQLAVGYNLRELEVREEMKQSLQSIIGEDDDDSSVDFSEPGALE